ncbi:MAG: hypothetical protein KDK55_01430 [Chlamydiia bacterium]|nr:hypothetical protein [Chlamydiia bacterium]
MSLTFQKRLEKYLKIACRVKINQNRSTMLNLLTKQGGCTRVSIHRMFLDAPDEVIASIAHYVRGTRRDKQLHDGRIKQYIHENLDRYNDSHQVIREKLITRGKIYDLQTMYDRLNAEYFNHKLELTFTWYGDPKKRCRSRIVFGQYLSTLRLIKIHALLDHPRFPYYFVSFVLYHEMLHAIVPVTFNASGKTCIHGPEFKILERRFRYYKEAKAWEKMHRDQLFR